MIKIKKVNREYKKGENEYTGKTWVYYPGDEENFIKEIEFFCNTVGENNIISVQFLKDSRNNDIESCVITYREFVS